MKTDVTLTVLVKFLGKEEILTKETKTISVDHDTSEGRRLEVHAAQKFKEDVAEKILMKYPDRCIKVFSVSDSGKYSGSSTEWGTEYPTKDTIDKLAEDNNLSINELCSRIMGIYVLVNQYYGVGDNIKDMAKVLNGDFSPLYLGKSPKEYTEDQCVEAIRKYWCHKTLDLIDR